MYQLPLSVTLRDDAKFENFCINDNALLVEKIQQSVGADVSDDAIFLWGAKAAGKTHLLQAVCDKATKLNLSAAYIPLGVASELKTTIFDGLESYDVICVDDVDAISGKSTWEKAVFELYNRVHGSHTQLFFSSTYAIQEVPFQLPDLSSRLSWGFVFHLASLTDEEKPQAIQMHAKGRGFELPDNVLMYLLNYYPRDMNVMSELLDELDTASLTAQRKLTIPFVKQWLGLGAK